MKKKISSRVIFNKKLTGDVFELSLEAPEITKEFKAGQFVMLYLEDGVHLLPRPISICDGESGVLRLVIRKVGYGTDYFSKLSTGDEISILGPLGNSFALSHGSSVIFGGGVGIPPMLCTAKALYEKYSEKVTAVLGFRDSNTFLTEDFTEYADVIICTDDGSLGERGNVIEVARRLNLNGDNIYACGPVPMLRGVKEYSAEIGASAQISLEERMACGVGVCLGCVVKTADINDHSKVKNARVCKDGPVFFANEVEI